ncbi:MAG: glutamate synthase [Acidobacteria bacterium]|nr:glutamate synthase [Acidobacteriota bacterium]
MAEITPLATVECGQRPIREINQEIKALIAAGRTGIELAGPGARHNLGVGIVQLARIHIRGSAGYYCAGLIDGPEFEVDGSAGWGLAESMMSGKVVVHGNAGNGAAAAIRGGTVVIHGDAAARLGVSMKGGLVLVGGDCGYMAAFMGQKGTLIVCGNTGEAFADSMYETTCFVGGKVGDLGTDAVIEPLSEEDIAMLDSTLATHFSAGERARKPAPRAFQKIVAGRKLWNFDKRNWQWWREAL